LLQIDFKILIHIGMDTTMWVRDAASDAYGMVDQAGGGGVDE
jgi:hypothetical protein